MKIEEDIRGLNLYRPLSSLLKAAYLLLSSSIFFLFICCTGHPREVRVEGQFEHLEQGEFLIYSTDEALDRVDTLHILDGSFSYTLPTLETATLHILYPNQSELIVFGNPGADIVVKGDAQNLSEVEVSGSEDNECYTEFRKETIGKSVAEAREIAHNYILEHPTLAVSQHLFTTYYLCDDAFSDRKEATELYDSLCRACPDDLGLSKLATHVRALGVLRIGQPLPDFSLTLKAGHGGNGDEDRVITRADYRDKLLLIAFWSSWKSGSQSAIFRSRKLRRELKGRGKSLELISYSLDGNEKALSRLEERDSIDWASYCDYLCLSSPLVQQWGIRELPYVILVTPDGRIAAMGSDWSRDIAPAADKL